MKYVDYIKFLEILGECIDFFEVKIFIQYF